MLSCCLRPLRLAPAPSSPPASPRLAEATRRLARGARQALAAACVRCAVLGAPSEALLCHARAAADGERSDEAGDWGEEGGATEPLVRLATAAQRLAAAAGGGGGDVADRAGARAVHLVGAGRLLSVLPLDGTGGRLLVLQADLPGAALETLSTTRAEEALRTPLLAFVRACGQADA